MGGVQEEGDPLQRQVGRQMGGLQEEGQPLQRQVGRQMVGVRVFHKSFEDTFRPCSH